MKHILTVALLLACAHHAQAPSVVIIVADDLGHGERHLMPSLDAMAAEGTTFDRFYVWPTCSVTRIGLLFGEYARRYGVGDLSMNAHATPHDKLPLGALSIAEVFAPTHATMLIGKWHLGRAPLNGEMDSVTSGPYVQGFEGWRAGSPTVVNAGPGASGYYDWQRVQAGDMFAETQYATDVQRAEFVNWWMNTSGPKFCVLSWSAPHFPYDAPPGMTLQPTARENYEQVIEYLDGQLEIVLDAIEPDAYVFFLADNGPDDGARPPGTPPGTHKGSTFEGGVRVPLLVRGPGVPAGVVSQRLVSAVDIGKTAADLAGVPVLGGHVDARSFADALGGVGEKPRSWVFSERWDVTAAGLGGTPIGYDDQAVIHAQWKLRLVDEDGTGPNAPIERWYFLPTEVELTPSPVIQAMMLAELASLPPRAP